MLRSGRSSLPLGPPSPRVAPVGNDCAPLFRFAPLPGLLMPAGSSPFVDAFCRRDVTTVRRNRRDTSRLEERSPSSGRKSKMDESSGAVTAAVVATVLLSLGVYVFSSIALGRIFVKLGDQAWKGWVPIVNVITVFELGRYRALWVVGLFIPAVNLVAFVILVMAVNNVNRRLGHGGGHRSR